MSRSISAFFRDLGAPLRNPRWSWGAVAANGLTILRVWEDDIKTVKGQSCVQITYKERPGARRSAGFNERQWQVEAMKAGTECYLIMCEAEDPAAVPRRIKSFNRFEIFVAGKPFEHEGNMWVPIVDIIRLR